jgi:hypothetical protein
MFTKLKAIRMPEIKNVHCLSLERVTSHGKNESIDATDAPRPSSTSRDGRAQQSSVPTDVNREK